MQSVRGLRLEDCHNIYLMGIDDFGISDPRLYPSSSGDQPESVVITGDSSGIVLQDLNIMFGTGSCSNLAYDHCYGRETILQPAFVDDLLAREVYLVFCAFLAIRTALEW